MGVDRQPGELEVQQPRHRLEARVGEGLGQKEVAGLQKGGEDDGQAVLAAGAHQHPLGRGRDSGAPDPVGSRLPVLDVSPGGRVVEEAAEVGAFRERAKRGGQSGAVEPGRRLRRVVLRQVDEAVRARVLRGVAGPAPDERAPPDLPEISPRRLASA